MTARFNEKPVAPTKQMARAGPGRQRCQGSKDFFVVHNVCSDLQREASYFIGILPNEKDSLAAPVSQFPSFHFNKTNPAIHKRRLIITLEQFVSYSISIKQQQEPKPADDPQRNIKYHHVPSRSPNDDSALLLRRHPERPSQHPGAVDPKQPCCLSLVPHLQYGWGRHGSHHGTNSDAGESCSASWGLSCVTVSGGEGRIGHSAHCPSRLLTALLTR